MAVTLSTAENALKSVYLGVLQNQLNTKINPFYAKIKKTTSNIYGKDVVKLAPIGITGGIGAGSEDGNLPSAGASKYLTFRAPLKNLYGTIEISDKAVRVSETSAGEFINLLNEEMQNLVKAAEFNLGRMLFGRGTGLLGTIQAVGTLSGRQHMTIANGGIRNFVVGQTVDATNEDQKDIIYTGKVVDIDYTTGRIFMDRSFPVGVVMLTGKVFLSGSRDLELTGLEHIFDCSEELYGNARNTITGGPLNPVTDSTTSVLSDIAIQTLIDNAENNYGTKIDYITCNAAVRRKLQALLTANNKNVDYVELESGVKAMSYNGIPVVVDKFVPAKTMYFLDSSKFGLYQLCDWKWIEGESGRILTQVAGKPVYNATLVKYAEMICDLPAGQTRFSNITE